MELWNTILEYLEQLFESSFSEAFLRRIRFKELQNNNLIVLSADDAFSKGWFEENCLVPMKDFLEEQGYVFEVSIEIIPVTKSNPIEVHEQPEKKSFESNNYKDMHLSAEYIFENFIPGQCNDFPYHAALAVVQSSLYNSYNPLVVTGPIGSGKTHLAQAIVHAYIAKFPQKKAIFVTSEEFTNDFIKSLQTKNMNIFRDKYRSCDLLVMDDVQALVSRESTAEELGNVFNALISRGSQMVFTADRSIEILQGLDIRLKTRLQGGLAVELKNPGFETRKAILLAIVERENYNIDDKIINLIAESIEGDIRALKGFLIKLCAYGDLKKKNISLKLAKELLSDKIQIDIPEDLSIHEIQKAVAKYFGITLASIRSDSKLNAIAYPRQVAMFIAAKHTKLSSTEIGNLFGKSHSTVLRSAQKIENELPKSTDLRRHVDRILLDLIDARH